MAAQGHLPPARAPLRGTLTPAVPDVTVLRLGHRPERDKRVTTHVCLTARAFGASRAWIAEEDPHLADGVRSVADRFGGGFEVETGTGWRTRMRDFDGTKVHLTMYGLPHDEVAPQVPRDRPLLVVVGAEKVPREVYEMADWNVSVGNQPHSEVAALAVFLYETLGRDALRRDLGGAMRIRPSARGKDVEGPDE